MDPSGLLAAALELYQARQYPSVVATCADAVVELPADDPAVGALRLLAARSLLALRRDAEAQREIRECLRLDPQCAAAYRLLGELAARADQLASAKIFFREAVRLAPDDLESHDWLALVETMARPTAAAALIPAANAAVGRLSPRAPSHARPSAVPTAKPSPVAVARPSPDAIANRILAKASQDSFAKPIPVASPRPESIPAPVAPRARATLPPPRRTAAAASAVAAPAPLALPLRAAAPTPTPEPAVRARGTSPPAVSNTVSTGFGQYLVDCGLLSPVQLRAATVYQRSTGVRLGAAAVALGFVSEAKADWASLNYQRAADPRAATG